MNRLILVSAFAASMILIAAGVAAGTIQHSDDNAMLVLLPGIAFAVLDTKKGCAIRGCRA
jgi:hypothetical protein